MTCFIEKGQSAKLHQIQCYFPHLREFMPMGGIALTVKTETTKFKFNFKTDSELIKTKSFANLDKVIIGENTTLYMGGARACSGRIMPTTHGAKMRILNTLYSKKVLSGTRDHD